MDSGNLSQFLGTWSKDFYGGPAVRAAMEEAWAAYFKVKHAISVNSATSGLYAALGALDLKPGDEVIVTPHTMSATASGILLYGAVPVFADIDPNTYRLSPEDVKSKLTPRTKAIMVVDLFGHPAEFNALKDIVKARNIKLIEDAAQAPGALYKGSWAGTQGDMGVFSLNYHKTIHCGEGGVIVTNDDDLANRLCLIRNHGEVVVKSKGDAGLNRLIGFNYRRSEDPRGHCDRTTEKAGAIGSGPWAQCQYTDPALVEHFRPTTGRHPTRLPPWLLHAHSSI